MNLRPKLPQAETTIFAVMSALANQHNAINLGQGFPDFDCDERLRQLVTKHLNSQKNQYCPMPGLLDLRQAIANKMNKSYGCSLNGETQICITAGATQAIFTAIQTFVHQGDEVIIIEPAYDSYLPSIVLAGGIPKAYRLTYPDYSIDWKAFEQLITHKTRMIIINTPHNPTGTILKKADMQALERIVAGKDIIVLSDEVYEHLIYDNEPHQSIVRFPTLFDQSLAVYSFGKTFHSTGWKIGYCVGPADLMEAFKNVHQWNVFSVNSFVQYALAEYLQDEETYNYLPDFFQQKRDYFTERVTGVPLTPKVSQGTYFQLFHYEAVSDLDDVAFAKYLTSDIGVAAIPLSPFYSNPPNDKVIRLCFAKTEATLAQAAERLQQLKS